MVDGEALLRLQCSGAKEETRIEVTFSGTHNPEYLYLLDKNSSLNIRQG
jgi:hypothetical protein